jgi:hypothetical protein
MALYPFILWMIPPKRKLKIEEASLISPFSGASSHLPDESRVEVLTKQWGERVDVYIL